MLDYSEATEKAIDELRDVVLQTLNEHPEITQIVLSQVIYKDRSTVSRYINGELGMPLSVIPALRSDPRTRPLAVAIIRHLAGPVMEVREMPDGENDGEPIAHDLLQTDLTKAKYMTAIEDRKPTAAMEALDEWGKILSSLRLKTADKAMRTMK